VDAPLKFRVNPVTGLHSPAVGGLKSRIMAEMIIMRSKKTILPVPVACIEHGIACPSKQLLN
jgi:hypothetical protein